MQVTDRTVSANPTGFDMRTELNNIIGALESDNSGSSEPLNPVAYMKWLDTSNATYYYYKERNHDNTAWVTLFRYTVATKIMEVVSNGVVLQDSALVHKTGNETIAGVKTFSSSPIVPVPTTDFQATSARSTNITVNVGAGQTYTTINQALEYLSGFYPLYKNFGVTATINLKAGFVVQESVSVSGLNLGWIRISSESNPIMIDHTKVTGGYVFIGINGASLPIINFQMDFSTRKTNGKGGINLQTGSTGIVSENCGIIGAGLDGVKVNASTLVCINSIFSQSGQNGILAQGSSRVQANGATVNSCDASGISGQTSSTIQFENGKVENQTSAEPRVKVAGGAIINAGYISTTGGTSTVYSQAINTITSNGIIFG